MPVYSLNMNAKDYQVEAHGTHPEQLAWKEEMKDSPDQVNVYFEESTYQPKGWGEPFYPPLFSALTNDGNKATRKRIRQLPFKKHGFI